VLSKLVVLGVGNSVLILLLTQVCAYPTRASISFYSKPNSFKMTGKFSISIDYILPSSPNVIIFLRASKISGTSTPEKSIPLALACTNKCVNVKACPRFLNLS
jgi:hypothetical protein